MAKKPKIKTELRMCKLTTPEGEYFCYRVIEFDAKTKQVLDVAEPMISHESAREAYWMAQQYAQAAELPVISLGMRITRVH